MTNKDSNIPRRDRLNPKETGPDIIHKGDEGQNLDEADNKVWQNEYRKYVLILELRDVSNLTQLENVNPHSRLWISYEFLGRLVQSEQFYASGMESLFPRNRNMFIWNGRHPDVIQLYLCAQERVLGVAVVHIVSLFFGEGNSSVLGKKEIKCKLCPMEAHENELQKQLFHDAYIKVVVECAVLDDCYQGHNISMNKSHLIPLRDIFSQPAMEPLICSVEERIAEVAKQLSEAKLQIERKHKEWDLYVQREEKKFQKHLKDKEEKVRNYLNLKIQQNQDEHCRTMDFCKAEYKKIEARLKKSLRDVESRERELVRQYEERDTMLKKKLMEVDIKEQMLREEAQHLIDVEVAKLQSAQNKIVILEKDIENANKRNYELQTTLDEERKRYKDSHENRAKEELSSMRCRIIELESQLKREISEKNDLSLELERYRVAAHKLAKLIRKERDMNCPKSETSKNDESSCSITRSEKLQQIKSELIDLISLKESES